MKKPQKGFQNAKVGTQFCICDEHTKFLENAEHFNNHFSTCN